MIELVLHPGHSKCGSTSIQRAVQRNRKELEKQGVFFPDGNFLFSFDKNCEFKEDTPRRYFKNIIQSPTQKELSRNLMLFSSRLDEVLDSALKNNIKKIIVTAENLVNDLSNGVGKKIHEILASKFSKVKIVYIIRRQDEFIVSAWQQWAHKQNVGIEQFVNNCLDKKHPNYLVNARFFSNCYGANNLQVLPLKNRTFGSNIIETFFDSINVECSNLDTKDVRLNETLNPHLCEVLAQVDGLYTSVHDDAVKIKLLELTDRSPVVARKDKWFLSIQVREKILQRFEQHNRDLHREFLSEFSYEEVFGSSIEEKMDSRKNRVEQLQDLVEVLALSLIKKGV
jgi:hypothetical protein